MDNFDVIVVGGGASGMMAAGIAAKHGSKVLLLEKMFRPGRKLRITGKGRCNLTNLNSINDFLNEVNDNTDFLRNSFTAFYNQELIDFFKSINIETKIERGKRVFPKSEKAQDVVDGMTTWLRKSKVNVQSNARVSQLIIENNRISGVKLVNGNSYMAKSVILCTGGASYPATGSTGDGYKLAKNAGHKIEAIRPALVPLKLSEKLSPELDRLLLKNIKVSVYQNKKLIAEKFGDLQFLKYQISGPIILSLSRELGHLLVQKTKLRFSIDLKPAFIVIKLQNRFLSEVSSNPHLVLKNLLRKLLPPKMIPMFISKLKMPPTKLVKSFNDSDTQKLISQLKDFSIEVNGLGDFSEAIVTAGGVKLEEINPLTLESKKIKHLFMAGELLNLDANTGGYNLQIAFSTAYLAGISAAKI
jgi:predicted Rossmann fold flavoprotein